MSWEKEGYKLIYKKSNKGDFILLKGNIQQERERVLLKIGGKNIEKIFNEIEKVLKEKKLIEEESSSNNSIRLKLNQDIGPIVAGFLILIRRSREPLDWITYFEPLIQGDKYLGSKEVLYHIWFLSVDLSNSINKKLSLKYQLNPKILDSVGAATKIIAKKMWKIA
ncbi:hypothetical protein [Caldisphaera lagunensis]|nr:hypothetical protein [Caldisphaera lagunensis]